MLLLPSHASTVEAAVVAPVRREGDEDEAEVERQIHGLKRMLDRGHRTREGILRK
jgi:hypothetical protein